MGDEAHDRQTDELRESAAELGVDDVDRKDDEQLVEEARRAQGDSSSSPTNPDWEKDGPRDDVAGAGG
jgi:hypothetical protein